MQLAGILAAIVMSDAWLRFTAGRDVHACWRHDRHWSTQHEGSCKHACLLVQVFLNDDGSEMELGRGGFGVVLRGTYRMAPVAIKRLKDQSLEQQEVFMREMALLRGCRGSRYIVPFVGASLQPVGSDNPLQFTGASQGVRRLAQLGEHGRFAVTCAAENAFLLLIFDQTPCTLRIGLSSHFKSFCFLSLSCTG